MSSQLARGAFYCTLINAACGKEHCCPLSSLATGEGGGGGGHGTLVSIIVYAGCFMLGVPFHAPLSHLGEWPFAILPINPII